MQGKYCKFNAASLIQHGRLAIASARLALRFDSWRAGVQAAKLLSPQPRTMVLACMDPSTLATPGHIDRLHGFNWLVPLHFDGQASCWSPCWHLLSCVCGPMHFWPSRSFTVGLCFWIALRWLPGYLFATWLSLPVIALPRSADAVGRRGRG